MAVDGVVDFLAQAIGVDQKYENGIFRFCEAASSFFRD